MSKQKFSQYLRLAIWQAYNKKSGYEGIPISFIEMEIDHIIPERVLLNPKEPNEFLKWKEKYNLDDNFDIHGIENLCPSTREFNLSKYDHGLFDETDAYNRDISKALIKAKQLKPKIEELHKEYKKQFDLRNVKTIADIKILVEKGKIDLKSLVLSGLKVDYEEVEKLEDLEKYENILKKYRSQGIIYYNFGVFFEIKSALRYSQYQKKEDLDFWIKIFNEFLSKVDDNKLKNNVFYELLFAMFKTNQSWKPLEIQLLEYFKSMKNEKNLETLQQSSILFNIFYGEFQRGRINSSIDTIFEFREFLLNNLFENIKNSKTETRIANLEYSFFLIQSSFTPEEYELIERKDENFERLWVQRYFLSLNNIINIVENVKFFDFNEFYNLFTKISEQIPIIRKHPSFDEVFSRIATLKNNYEGTNSTITDLMKRGIELYDNNLYLQAIKQFQLIKNLSFNPDKLYTCLFSFYYIGECYNNLGLFFASKYYFMVVFHLANEMDVEYNIKQLTYSCGTDRIAMIDYKINNVLEGIYFTSISLLLREFYSLKDFETPIEKNNISALVENALKSLAYSIKKSRNLSKTTKDFYETLGLLDLIEESITQLKFSYTKEDINKIDENVGLLFKDAKNPRQYSWLQLGINWTIKWDNIFLSTSLSEEFIAYTQIFLSALEDIDIISPCDIEFKLKSSNKFCLKVVNGEKIIEVPIKRDSGYFHDFFVTILSLIMENMIISKDQVMEKVEPLFEIGFFSNSYIEIYKKLVHPYLFDFYSLINGVKDE